MYKHIIAYNRKTQSHRVFTSFVTIRFYDDNKEVIRKLWHNYYIFYNADATYDIDGNAYTSPIDMQIEMSNNGDCKEAIKDFSKNIKIYSMQNHKFAEYTLVNSLLLHLIMIVQ